jgi:hypothetical protein
MFRRWPLSRRALIATDLSTAKPSTIRALANANLFASYRDTSTVGMGFLNPLYQCFAL